MTIIKSLYKNTLLLLLILFAAAPAISIADDSNLDLGSPSYVDEFLFIYSQIQQYYVDEIDDETMFKNAIKGLVEGLDPHSSYLDPKDQADLSESSIGKFGGLGIVITQKDDLIQIISPIDDTPAYRAGLQSGDIILKIGDKSVREMDLEEGVNLMRGEPGTTIELTIGRAEKVPFKIEITREIITIVSVRGFLLDDGIAYIRISDFQSPSAKLLKDIVSDLIDENDGSLDSVILDLRNNPGGLLTSAVNIANLFIDSEGLVVYTEGRVRSNNSSFPTKPGDILNGALIVVLMNVGSASASEIVAGALQDHKRAIIMGETSFGKGSVQSIIDLSNGYGLKLTTARYFTPSGRSIQATGIEPDIFLENITLNQEEESLDLSRQEKDLKNHLTPDNPNELSEEEILDIQDEIKEDQNLEIVEYLKNDYYVHEAINLLKALRIVGNK